MSICSCTSKSHLSTQKRVLTGKYQTNFSPFGISSTEIVFKKNGTCLFETSRHMQMSFKLPGKYIITSDTLYIKFDKPKEIEQNNSISADSIWTITDEYNRYELKTDNHIAYHAKYLLENGKLYIYRYDLGKFIKEAETYSDERGRHTVPYYLEKISH